MADVLTRRAHLAQAIQHMPEPIHASDLAAASAAAGFGAARNTARLDARWLTAHGHLVPLPGPGNRTYTRTESPVAYLLCPAGDCTSREAYDPTHQTSGPTVPADADRAHDALVEHLVVAHAVPRDEVGRLASQARRVSA